MSENFVIDVIDVINFFFLILIILYSLCILKIDVFYYNKYQL